MRILSLLSLALILAACDSPADPSAEAPADAPSPAAPENSTGMTIDTAIAAGEIPARFHGVWDAVAGSCDLTSDTRVKITARRVEYYESVGDVSGMDSDGDDAIADLAMTGEGESWVRPTRLSLETTRDGERLRLSDAQQPESADDLLRKRCSG